MTVPFHGLPTSQGGTSWGGPNTWQGSRRELPPTAPTGKIWVRNAVIGGNANGSRPQFGWTLVNDPNARRRRRRPDPPQRPDPPRNPPRNPRRPSGGSPTSGTGNTNNPLPGDDGRWDVPSYNFGAGSGTNTGSNGQTVQINTTPSLFNNYQSPSLDGLANGLPGDTGNSSTSNSAAGHQRFRNYSNPGGGDARPGLGGGDWTQALTQSGGNDTSAADDDDDPPRFAGSQAFRQGLMSAFSGGSSS